MDDDMSSDADGLSTSELLTVWQVVAARRASYDAMMWQTPALGMTAQAFLLTLALGSGASNSARMISAALSILISLMVVHLLAKHRRNEFLDSLVLEEIEAGLDFSRLVGFHPHAKNRYRQRNLDIVDQATRRILFGPSRFWSMSSFRLSRHGKYVLSKAGCGRSY